MNLLLFETLVEEILLPPGDSRSLHVREVLRRVPGDEIDVAVVNGPKGKATVLEDCESGMRLSFLWEEVVEDDRCPIHLLLGLSRPQTARKILGQASSLGVTAMNFFGAEKGEASYADSKLWKTDEWRRHRARGIEQAFCSFLPEVRRFGNLEDVLLDIPELGQRVALDVYEAETSLSTNDAVSTPIFLAIGSERGWSGNERDLLRESGFVMRHLGSRVLRQETAVVAALGILGSPHWR